MTVEVEAVARELATSTPTFPGYPAYRDSGIRWLGNIPEHWETKRLKHFAGIVLGKMLQTEPTPSDDYKPYLRSANIQWERVDVSDIKYMWFSKANMDVFRVKRNDLLVSEGGEVGRTCIWNDELEECYLQNSVHKVTCSSSANPRYVLFQLFTMGYTGILDASVNRVSIAHLTGEKLANLAFALPPLAEQCAIAAHLDRETARIDALVAAKERLIALLQEKRVALISRAVTRGLDPNAPMKDSGVPWLGKIPAHWQILTLRRVVHTFVDYRGATPNKVTGGIPLITAKNIKNGAIDFSLSQEFVSEDDYLTRMVRGFPEIGDVLVTTEAPLGETAQITDERITLAQRVILLKVEKYLMTNEFLKNYLMSGAGAAELWSRATGSTAIGIKASHLKEILVPIPPLREQVAISKLIDREAAKLDTLIARIRQHIEKVKEYRAALISAAVTGKIDVRSEEPAHE